MDEIKNIINTIIGTLSSKKTTSQQEIQCLWKKLLGEKEQGHSQVVELKGKVLIVNVDSSPWLYQFNLRKGKLLKELQKEIPDIKRIYFRIGKVL